MGWEWYLAKRRGEPVVMNVDDPQPGFYRKPFKEHYGARYTFTPVAYYEEDGKLKCREGDDDTSPERGLELWHWVGHHDRDEAEWRGVAERGERWNDEHELVPMQGDNRPPEPETFEELRDAIEDLAREAHSRLDAAPVADQDEADRIANLGDRLNELQKRAKALRDEEKRPHTEAAATVQSKWAPLILAADIYKSLKQKLLTPWGIKETARKKLEAEAAAAAGQPAAAETRRTRMGTRGRAMSLKGRKRADIFDYNATREFFKDSEDMVQLVQTLADRAARSGVTTIPGANIVEEMQVV
jgi:hypothetical protein